MRIHQESIELSKRVQISGTMKVAKGIIIKERQEGIGVHTIFEDFRDRQCRMPVGYRVVGRGVLVSHRVVADRIRTGSGEKKREMPLVISR